MDITKLHTKRHLTVHEQSTLTRYSIEQSACSFRMHPLLPDVLLQFFVQQGIHLQRDILTNSDRMPFGGEQEAYRGQWLTCSHRFFNYVLFLDETNTHIEEVARWADVTDTILISAHEKGIGKSYGYLCQEVLHQLNHQ